MHMSAMKPPSEQQDRAGRRGDLARVPRSLRNAVCRGRRRRLERAIGGAIHHLLFTIATDVRFKFDRVQLKKGVYSPQAHGELEREQIAARKLALEVLAGQRAIKMDVANFPADEDALKAQTDLNKALARALAGQGALTVSIQGESKPGPSATPPLARVARATCQTPPGYPRFPDQNN
jgi:hypothetical protein